MDGYVNGWMCLWMDVFVDGCVCGWMCLWMDVFVDGSYAEIG